VTRPWSRATPPAASVGVVYLSITNRGKEPDRLLGAASPVAASVEIHETRASLGMMRMRPVAAVDLPPGQSVRFESGGTHIMLVGLKHALIPNAQFPLELKFDRAGVLRVVVRVGEGP
jgi:copper(I)-binding protein